VNIAMIRHLVAKDLRFQRVPMAVAGVVSVAALAMLSSSSELTFYVGSVLLISVVISVGIYLALMMVLAERTQGMLPFVMSLPIGVREYTLAKLLSSLALFLAPWSAIGAGAAAVILVRGAIPDGLLPFAVVLLLHLLTGYVLTLGVALVSESEGWTIGVAGAANLAVQGFIYWTAHLSDVAAVIGGPAVVWTTSIRRLILAELLAVALILAATWVWQSRRTDFP
jgi:ABC-2 type transport system permease protein